MTRILSIVAFILGGIIVLWMGASFVGSNALAFAVMGVIAVVYVIGFMELMRFQQATRTLDDALATIDTLGAESKISVLDEWLSLIAPALRNSVRLRIKGEFAPLPMPMLTPYLVGLLVMLGLLGTFAGMVDTLKGAVSALEGTTELAAIREGLSAPIKGLSLAFGTSVAGVSASAMLGFISTLSRRERQLASQHIDGAMNTAFQDFSLSYNREQTFKAMQSQAESLPLVADTLATMAARMETFSQDINQQLISQQTQFHDEMRNNYRQLAESFDRSLQDSVKTSSEQMGAQLTASFSGVEPLIQTMTESVNRDLSVTHQKIAEQLTQHTAEVSQHMSSTTEHMANTWQQGVNDYHAITQQLSEQQQTQAEKYQQTLSETSGSLIDRFSEMNTQWLVQQQAQDQQRNDQLDSHLAQATDATQAVINRLVADQQQTMHSIANDMQTLLSTTEQLVEQRAAGEAQWLDRHDAQVSELTSRISEQLNTLRDDEARRGDAVVDQLAGLSDKAAEHLQRLGQGLEAPLTQLIETASETPRAAAEVISQLREEMSNTVERDNQLLTERQAIFEQLTTVANTLESSSREQQEALNRLTSQSAETLSQLSERFGQTVNVESTRLSDAADQFSGSAVELASLGDAFGVAVEQFGESSRDIKATLSQIEQALADSGQRSDEQMGYYVAQAREIIDHTLLSQQEMMEQLRQIGRSAS
ncbi:hypothetical protein ACVBE9_08970 [Eionea flava]